MSVSVQTRIKPCLWFDDNLEEAAELYVGLFPDSFVSQITRLHDDTVVVGTFTLAGLSFMAINGGPQFRFNEAVSFSVTCADQDEVDRYWDALTADGGEESMCGWLKDRFGLSWQIVPQRLYDLLEDPDPARAGAASAAMMGMRRIDVAGLEAAADAVAPSVKKPPSSGPATEESAKTPPMMPM